RARPRRRAPRVFRIGRRQVPSRHVLADLRVHRWDKPRRGAGTPMNSTASRLLSILPVLAVCAGCAGATADRLALADISSIAAEPRVTVFTTRNAIKGAAAKPWFGTERAKQPSIAEVR